MNSLANLNSVVDQDHGDPASHSWSPDGWAEPPVATICTGATLSNHTATASRLHFHPQSTATTLHSAEARHNHDWDSWSSADHHNHHQLILAAAAAHMGDQYSGEDQQTEATMQDCKPNVMHLDSLRQYNNSHNHNNGNGFLTASSSSIAMAASPTSPWPNVLSVVRQNSIGMQESNTSSSSGGYNSYGILNSAGSSSPTTWQQQQQQQLHQNGYCGGAGSAALHNYLSESCRTGMTSTNIAEQRHYNHLLGLSSVDQQRRIHDILKGGLYSTNMASAAGGHGSTTTTDYSRIGLNLGVRTYFSTEDSANAYALARFSKRFQPALPTMHVPLCQAEGCKADLSIAKHYHRRHKVCEFHSKASTVIINGNTQRFCQQCSRFHALSEFDEGKRSCRKRLADHNRRRRKPQPINTSSSTQAGNSDCKTAGDGGGSAGQAPHPPNTGAAATTTSSSPPASSCKNDTSSAGKLRSIDQESTKTETTGRTSCEEPGKAVELVRVGIGGASSTMAAPPSVILTLQNNAMARSAENNQATANTGSSMLSSEEINQEKEPAYFLKGPSLSLSAGAGSSSVASNSTNSHGHHSNTATVTESTGRKFEEVELSVPWLTRAHRSMANTVMQQQQDQAASAGGLNIIPMSSAKDVKACDSLSNTSHFMIAEHMQNLEASTVSDHHQQQQRSYIMHGSKTTENPWLLDNAMTVQEELRLLETSNQKNSSEKDHHHADSHRLHHAMFDGHHAEANHQDQNGSSTSRGGPLPLGFLQQQNHHVHHHGGGPVQFNAIMSSRAGEAGPASDNSSVSSLSLHSRMQVDHALRPLDGALHASTADFIKDGFV